MYEEDVYDKLFSILTSIYIDVRCIKNIFESKLTTIISGPHKRQANFDQLDKWPPKEFFVPNSSHVTSNVEKQYWTIKLIF